MASLIGFYSLVFGFCSSFFIIFFSIKNFRNRKIFDYKIISLTFLQFLFVATSILVILGLIAAYVATFFVDTNILTLILSFSPGGIYEVAVIAIAFDLDPDFVAFHHIIRLLFILLTVPIFLRILEKLRNNL